MFLGSTATIRVPPSVSDDVAGQHQTRVLVDVECAIRETRVARTEDLQRRPIEAEFGAQRSGDVNLAQYAESLFG
jgi:hypothetical protein